MSRKIYHAIWLVALVVFLASLVCIMGVLYRYFTDVQMSQLESQTDLAAQGAALEGEDYFTGLTGARITWIAADGSVLYDSEANRDTMENHLQRQEVRQALENGSGNAVRYSSTLSERLLYCAKRLPDGSVIRLSTAQKTFWALLYDLAQPICLMILVALVLSLVLASRASARIVEPINSLNLDTPAAYVDQEEYREIAPLLRRMAQQQSQLKKDRAKLEQTAKIRQEFTANVSHELKTPLQSISGYAELLETGMVRPEDVKPFAGKIHREAQRMTKLVEDIIDLTKLDDGGSEMLPERTDLARIAENAVDSLRFAAEEAGVTLTLQKEPSEMVGIPQVLYSIVYNLCDNAIKYNVPDGRVEVSVKPQGDRIRLVVRDTGIGIPADAQERIFERFYRVDKSHSKEVGGTGLGLSIVKHGAKIHNAEISLSSAPGEGSTFTLDFPTEQEEL